VGYTAQYLFSLKKSLGVLCLCYREFKKILLIVMSRAVFFGVFGFKSDKRAIVCYYKTKRHAGIGDKTVTLRTDWLNLHPFVFLLPTPA
jgi:hypothetical protein